MRLFLIFYFAFFSAIAAQTFSVSGKVIDYSTNRPLLGVNVTIGKTHLGASTDGNGNFIIKNVPKGNYVLKSSYIGYKSVVLPLNVNKNIRINIKMKPIRILLSETTIKGKKAKLRETPVAFSEVTSGVIEKELGGRYVTSALDNLPGIYISPQGGGFADSRLNLRGYDQTALSVMINGIPINNPENGEIYWSNWADLSDVISSIQVQRGLGASSYSVSPVGGNINIVTTGGFNLGPALKIKTGFGDFNYRKLSAAFAVPIAENNMRFTGLISRTTSDGYAEQTWLNMITYYFALGMNFGNHTLEIELMGSPQKHGQRTSPQTINTWALRGLKYNSDWGRLFGEVISTHDNKFHKPSLTINHNWEINKHSYLANTLYLSYGAGGGHVPPWGGFPRDESGHVDFDSVWRVNSSNIDSAYSTSMHRSISALRFTYHKHYWGAFKSTITLKKQNLTYSGGIDGSLYQAENYSALDNLLGGDYYIGSSNVNLPVNKKLFVGDKVDYDADSFARSLGGFAQIEYNSSTYNIYLNGAVGSTAFDRIDYFNYKTTDPARETGWKSFWTYRLKGGANFNFTKRQNIFFNIGSFSKAPLSMNVYTYSNKLYPEVKNEKVFSVELGYGYSSEFAELQINSFYTLWKDKALNFNIYVPETYSFFYANVYGAKSLHTGIEGEGKIKFGKNFSLNGSFTYGSYKWLNDVTAYLRPEGNPGALVKFNSKIAGLYEGNSPMTKIALGITLAKEIGENIKFSFFPNYLFFGRYYAMFDPASRSFENEKNVQSWRAPDYNRFDIHFSLSVLPKSKMISKIKLNFHLFNVLNAANIISASDGVTHDANSALVWYGRERWSSFSVELQF